MTRSSRPKRLATAAFALSASLFTIAALRIDAPIPESDANVTARQIMRTSRTAGDETGPSGAPAMPQAAAERQAPSVPPATPQTPEEPPTVSTRTNAPARQAAGRITGRVTDERGGAPLTNVQVYVVGGYLGTLTRATGAFVIADVPAGTYELRAERIGLTTRSAEVTVVDDGVAEVRFELAAQSIGLDEIRSLRPGEAPRTPTPAPASPAAVRPQGAPAGTPVFTPYTVRPQVTNVVEVQEALTREYPTALRDAGIGGSVFVNIFVSPEGTVRNALINESSRNGDLDQAALRVVQTMRFSPALNRDEAVAVWVTMPLTFRP